MIHSSQFTEYLNLANVRLANNVLKYEFNLGLPANATFKRVFKDYMQSILLNINCFLL